MGDVYEELAAPFVAHYETLRGALRHALVSEQVDEHLPAEGTLDVVDVGGGAGHQAIRLARLGHRVTLVDPSPEMLRRTRVALEAERLDVRGRLQVVEATATEAPRALKGEVFDAVLCHAVLPYVENPADVVAALGKLSVASGVLSIVFKNAEALAMRPALEGRWADAARAFDATADIGGLGVTTRAHTCADVDGWCATAGCVPRAWFGIRVMTDHLHDAPLALLSEVLPIEARAARTDPYRAVGRLVHALYERTREREPGLLG